MPQYRVDKLNFADGQEIQCNPNSYYDSINFSDDKRKIEDILNDNRPNKDIPIRNECLFIFNEFSDAVSFWTKQTNSHIYEVKKCEGTITYFRGDMNITDFMIHTSDNSVLEILAKQYWSPIFTFKPCIEILVNKIQVLRKLTSDEAQRKQAFKEYIDSGKKIESLTFYKTNLPI